MSRFLLLTAALSLAGPAFAASIPVSTDNFARAESDLYFSGIISRGELGKLTHERALADIAHRPSSV